MKLEKKELQKAVEQLGKSRDYFDQQIWEKEMQYAKKYEEVGEIHSSYGIWSLIFLLQIGGCIKLVVDSSYVKPVLANKTTPQPFIEQGKNGVRYLYVKKFLKKTTTTTWRNIQKSTKLRVVSQTERMKNLWLILSLLRIFNKHN